MTARIFGWSLPPGCSHADIERACGGEDPSPESDRVLDLLQSIDDWKEIDEDSKITDEIVNLVDELAKEKARLDEDLKDANARLSLLLRAGTLWAAFQESDSVLDQQTDHDLKREAQSAKEQLIEIINEGGY